MVERRNHLTGKLARFFEDSVDKILGNHVHAIHGGHGVEADKVPEHEFHVVYRCLIHRLFPFATRWRSALDDTGFSCSRQPFGITSEPEQ